MNTGISENSMYLTMDKIAEQKLKGGPIDKGRGLVLKEIWRCVLLKGLGQYMGKRKICVSEHRMT